eukprot:scaffold1148_cov335-Pavlova_lutheri.AAC.3
MEANGATANISQTRVGPRVYVCLPNRGIRFSGKMKNRASIFTNLSVAPNFPNPDMSKNPLIGLNKNARFERPLRVMKT